MPFPRAPTWAILDAMKRWSWSWVVLAACGGGDGAGAQDARPAADAPSLDAAAPDASTAALHCGTITADETWDASVSHLVTCDVVVEATLTIAAGAQVEFAADTGITAGVASPGILVIAGATLTSASATPAPGDWGGVALGAMSGGSAITAATIEYGDGVALADASPLIAGAIIRRHAGAGIRVTGAGAPTIRDAEIRDNGGDGVELAATADLGDEFANNVITGNAGHALSMPARSVRWLEPSSTYAGNGGAIRITGGTADQSGTWRALDADYLVEGTILIGGAAQPVITIAGGVTLRFNGQHTLQVGGGAGTQPGGLVVDGGTTPVRFTSAQAIPQPGDWYRLAFGTDALDGVNRLEGLVIEYGGGGGATSGSQLSAQGTDIVMVAVESRHSALSGASLGIGASASIQGSTFRDNAHYGLSLCDTCTLTAFADNTLSGNDVPMRLYADALGALDATSSFTSNTVDHVEVAGGTVTANATWRDLDVDYHVASTVTIAGSDDPVVTIEAGATFAFETSPGTIGFVVGSTATNGKGGLIAQGDLAGDAPITFTRAGSTGNWSGLRFLTFCLDPSSILDDVLVEYGGGSASYPGNVYTSGCGATITDSTIRDSARYGIYTIGTDPTISNITYANNASGDYY